MTKRLVLVALIFSLAAATANAQKPPTFEENELLATYLTEYSAYLDSRPARLTDQALTLVERTTSAIPQSVDAGGDSAARDENASFAPRLQLGIDSIEAGDEDGSFVVKWNQNEVLSGSLGVSATVRKTSAAGEILTQVDSTIRKALEGAIGAQLDDLDDVTLSVRWGYEGEIAGRQLGRRFELYERVLQEKLDGPLEELMSRTGGLHSADLNETLTNCELRALGEQEGNWGELTRSELENQLGEDFDGCLEAARARELAIVRLDKDLEPLHILAFLIDNQPQLVVTGLLHDRHELAGRDGWELSLSYEHGLCNLNHILGKTGCGDDEPGLDVEELAQLTGIGGKPGTKAQAGHKFTLTAKYAKRNRLLVDQVFGTGDDAISVKVDLPEAEEISGKLQYSRNATFHPVTVDGTQVFPKIHASAEYIDVSDDPQRRDRLVGQLTYEIPLTASATLPLSISYANHSKYLGEVDDEFSAHFGLSYSIKTKKKEGGGS